MGTTSTSVPGCRKRHRLAVCTVERRVTSRRGQPPAQRGKGRITSTAWVPQATVATTGSTGWGVGGVGGFGGVGLGLGLGGLGGGCGGWGRSSSLDPIYMYT